MSTFGILNILAAMLELCVPSYALRLVRRFGAHQVGSFVVIAFTSLAVLHLFNPLKTGSGTGLGLNLVYAAASVLLLIGMGHVETLCQQRQSILTQEQKLRAELELRATHKADDLVKVEHEMSREIVRLQQQVETLAASEKQFRLLFTHHPHPMWIFDLRCGRILAGNESALKQYGFSQQEFTDLAAKDLLAHEAAAAFRADSAKPCTALEPRGIWRHQRKDRSLVDVETLAVDIRFGGCPARLMMIEDIAPRLSREAELSELQRMRILHRIAEGVAHHFGQILTVVEGEASLLRDGCKDRAEAEHLGQVLAETRRGSALIRQLLAVGACESIQPEPMDLNEFIQGQQCVLRRLVGDRINLLFEPTKSLPPVLADVRALGHILVNLVLNARDALPECGEIEIHTQPAWLDPREYRGQPNSKICPGHFVLLTIRDNGCGMTPEVQERLFEPFFTTREGNHVMGLGLATTYGAVRQLGGSIQCESEPQRGTLFSVFLPVANITNPSNTSADQSTPPVTRETILLVEANDQVRELARYILRRNGYRIIEADSPSTAAVLMETQSKNVDLILTNLNFPGDVSGLDLAEQFRQSQSQLKVVYTAAAISPEVNERLLTTQARLLPLPFTPDGLLQIIKSSLSAEGKS